MDKNDISEKIARLDSVVIAGRPVVMGKAIYAACADRGLIMTDVEEIDGRPTYRGISPIRLLPGLPDWEFQIGPPNA